MSNSTLTLQNLVEAIMGSISEAQDQIERQTLENINEWFDEDGRPKMISFRVPAFGPEADKKRARGQLAEREIHVPLITLTQNNPIKIKKLISKFDISLNGVDGVDTATKNNKQPESRLKQVLSTDLFSGRSEKGDRKATMEIEFEAGEATEAYLKLQNELLKLF
ncbi:DUF2589 domain-containing protein [Vibrio sp. S9_S30]|uniref:DUF2589 domain-containing protein n=1 Tax=Vibrio sp. S9_S30 TaxID=2720226 RepID=UPI001680B7C8|nr:DUF2589 domain-containing protein [Vibrio sp. S9_S30]MBD1557266.1 DUF2589 domain-containing protein [Vibrio sp. S9_S30]